jgi:5-methylcytosine-specific restriction endonuclease McrA
LQVGCVSPDFRPMAEELVAKRKAHPEIEFHIDHIIPVAEGGCNCPANLQILSKEQHLTKTAREFKLPAE